MFIGGNEGSREGWRTAQPVRLVDITDGELLLQQIFGMKNRTDPSRKRSKDGVPGASSLGDKSLWAAWVQV